MRDDKDRSGKWLLQHHGKELLRLGGVTTAIQSCRALPAEVVQPKQLPDGLLEVTFAGATAADLFVVEIATYPEPRVTEQIVRDLMAVYLDRRVLPEVVTLVLHPRGKYRVPHSVTLRSLRGLSVIKVASRVVKLWTLPAEKMLAANEVGLIPWIPLMQFTGRPEPLLRTCRERIDQLAAPDEHANLLAVAQVLTRLRYNNPDLLALFGGSQAMIESPLIDEILDKVTREAVTKSRQDDILQFLKARWGPIRKPLTASIRAVQDEKRLRELIKQAALAPTLDAFRKQLG